MENMIERILNIDKLAREAKSEINKENVTLEEEIKRRKKEIREDYLKRAYERVRENSSLEEKSSAEVIARGEEGTKNKLSELENISKNNIDFWVNEIVGRVLSS